MEIQAAAGTDIQLLCAQFSIKASLLFPYLKQVPWLAVKEFAELQNEICINPLEFVTIIAVEVRPLNVNRAAYFLFCVPMFF